MSCGGAVAAASFQMAQQPSCDPATLRVIMCENFHHSCRACSGGSNVELKPGIEKDERANPNEFISAVIKPILAVVQRRHEATSVAVSSVSWAAGMARVSGRPRVLTLTWVRVPAASAACRTYLRRRAARGTCA